MYRTLLAALAALLLGAATADASTYNGTIDGAKYRAEVPERWNGTLVLYSHGYFPAGFPDFGIGLTNRPPDRSETEAWLLEHGYAMAASQFQDGGIGYQIKNALHDQIALLDWFETTVGRPRHTISTGQSLGAAIALLLAERHPDRFDGVLTMCGAPDPLGTWNANLDVSFAVKTLLAAGQDIELVRVTDAAGSTEALARAIQKAVTKPEGRARLALAGALGDVAGWYSPHEPRPTEPDEWIRQQALWIENAFVRGRGPAAQVDIERRAGGNPLWNVGIDYTRQLVRSGQLDNVRRAYHAARLDLGRDLAKLARAPRIAPDPRALPFMYRYGVPDGRISVPVVTLHSIGDGGAPPNQERWYAEQMRRPDLLRQLWVDRGAHCSFSAADEIVALDALVDRVETGRWPDTSPQRLNEAAGGLGEPYSLVLDFGTFTDLPMPPAFTTFTPGPPMRPSR